MFDFNRGIEVLRLRRGAAASGRMKAVTAPSVRRDRFAPQPVGSLTRISRADGGTGLVCPLFY